MTLYVKVKRTQLNGSLGDGLGVEELMDAADVVGEGAGFTQAAFVDDAAGANPTKAEFDALLASLQAAGLMASS